MFSDAIVVDVVDYSHGKNQQPAIKVLDGKELLLEKNEHFKSVLEEDATNQPPLTG